jgi:multiple sugar transport system substrate-binding protein
MQTRRAVGHCWPIGLALALALLVGHGAARADGFNWRQHEGVTLRVLLGDNHWQQVMQQHFPEFEKLTGIKLAVEAYPQPKLWDVLEQALGEPGRVDVFMTVPALDGPRFYRMGRIRAVDDLLQDAARTAPEFAWTDFLPRARAGMQVDGALLGPPLMAEHLALLYRRDLFQAHQVAVPKTLDELEAAARQLHGKPMNGKGGPGVALVARGNGSAATSLYAALLHAYGGRWLNGKGDATLTSPAGVEALALFGRLLGGYAPPRVNDFNWQEASALFMAGGAAMYLEGSSIYPLLEEPKVSGVAGKIGYAVFPAGPGGPGTTLAVRGLAVARTSANPGAAWLFCQWAAGPDMVRRALQKGVLVARESAWRDTATPRPVPADLAQSFQEAGRVGNTQWAPPMVAVTGGRMAVGEALEAVVRGSDARTVAAAANRKLQAILDETEPRRP